MAIKKNKDSNVIPSFLDGALGFNIYRTGLLFRRELMRALSEWEMTPEQWQVMMILWHTETPVNQRSISAVLLKDKHTLSRILKRLERDGWIEKHPNPKDARVTIIKLTEKGAALEEEVPPKLFNHFDKFLQAFDDREIKTAMRFLKKLRTALGD